MTCLPSFCAGSCFVWGEWKKRHRKMNTVFVFCLFLLVATALAKGKPKYCVKPVDESKCNATVAKGLNVTCVTSEDCLAAVVKGTFDLAYADANDLIVHVNGLKIVLTENVGLPKYVRYYGLAVVKKGSTLNLKELKGKKTCHTAAGKTVGWVIPVGYLLRTEKMPNLGNQWKSAAEYFGGSCVPGVKSKTNDEAVTKKLCQLCKDRSACSKTDGYADYEGAFKCMGDGIGDVAFVKHSTPELVTKNEPGKYGAVGNYSLLCNNGSMEEVDKYEECYIDYRPASAIVTKKDIADVGDYRKIIKTVAVADLVANKMLSDDTKSLDTYDDTTVKYLALNDYIKDVQALTKDKPTLGSSTLAVSLVLQILALLFMSFVV